MSSSAVYVGCGTARVTKISSHYAATLVDWDTLTAHHKRVSRLRTMKGKYNGSQTGSVLSSRTVGVLAALAPVCIAICE
jgi:hypothetical protein